MPQLQASSCKQATVHQSTWLPAVIRGEVFEFGFVPYIFLHSVLNQQLPTTVFSRALPNRVGFCGVGRVFLEQEFDFRLRKRQLVL